MITDVDRATGRADSGGGGVEKKFLVPAYGFFSRGVPPEGEGGTKKKFARKFFPDPETSNFLKSTPRVWVLKVQGGYFSR